MNVVTAYVPDTIKHMYGFYFKAVTYIQTFKISLISTVCNN